MEEKAGTEDRLYIDMPCGRVAGVCRDGYRQLLGIPYAQAERFGPPQACVWKGTWDCTHVGKKAMQDYEQPQFTALQQTRNEFDEDCLNLDVYIPQDIDFLADRLPVLVEIHGGAFQTGSTQERTPKKVIGNQKIIYVAMNYRLGVFGFLYLGELAHTLPDDFPSAAISGNLGLLDVLASLRWVHENCASFGGDPGRITVLGSSAGAKLLGSLMCIEEINVYAQQVIMSSGATQSIRDMKTAAVLTKNYMEILREITGKPQLTAIDLKILPADTLIAAQKILCDNPGNTCMFGPVADGKILPTNWQALAARGTCFRGRAMIGCSLHELALYNRMDPQFYEKSDAIAEALFGENAACAKKTFQSQTQAYTRKYGQEPSRELCADIRVQVLTDYMYRTHSYRLAARLAAKGCPVWQYSMEFLPALHCFEQILAFCDLIMDFFQSEKQMQQGQQLGEWIRDAFIRFIKTGCPVHEEQEWPQLSVQKPVQMVFDTVCYLRPIAVDEVPQDIGDQVYMRI